MGQPRTKRGLAPLAPTGARSRAYTRRMREAGRCAHCGKPAAPYTLCPTRRRDKARVAMNARAAKEPPLPEATPGDLVRYLTRWCPLTARLVRAARARVEVTGGVDDPA